jgi:hypothetical protein
LTIKLPCDRDDLPSNVTENNQDNHNRPTTAGSSRGNIMSDAKSVKLHELTMMPLNPIRLLVQRWWWKRAESHYLICADVEQERVREAQQNAAYFQKKAALARSQWMGKH